MFIKIQRIVASLQKQQEHTHTRKRSHEPQDLEALAREALAAASEETRGMARYSHTEPVPRVGVDRLELLRVLAALIRNAVEAVDEKHGDGSGQITLTTRARGDEVILEIRDNGVGIPSDHVSRLFVHGFSTKEQREGFGLHFAAISVKEMGGQIEVTSAGVGKGAVVRLKFPRASPTIAELSPIN
jgi:signal transduction histidine kinase